MKVAVAAALLAGCGSAGPLPRTGASVAHQLLGADIGHGLGKVRTGYCRSDYSGSFTCVLRTPAGRATCTVSIDADNRVRGTYCAKLG